MYIKKLADDKLELLYNYSPNKQIQRRQKYNPLFPYKFIRCPHCEKPFLGSAPTGKAGKKHPTYHCGRGHKYQGFPKKEFEAAIEKMVKKISFDQEFFDAFERILFDTFRKREEELLLQGENLKQKQALFELVFDEIPDYHQVLNGTPKLFFMFEIFQQSESKKSLEVAPRGIEPLFSGWKPDVLTTRRRGQATNY